MLDSIAWARNFDVCFYAQRTNKQILIDCKRLVARERWWNECIAGCMCCVCIAAYSSKCQCQLPACITIEPDEAWISSIWLQHLWRERDRDSVCGNVNAIIQITHFGSEQPQPRCQIWKSFQNLWFSVVLITMWRDLNERWRLEHESTNKCDGTFI